MLYLGNTNLEKFTLDLFLFMSIFIVSFYFVLLWSYIHWSELTTFHFVAFALVSLWSWRLTLNWARSWTGFHHEDWRYVDIAKQTGIPLE